MAILSIFVYLNLSDFPNLNKNEKIIFPLCSAYRFLLFFLKRINSFEINALSSLPLPYKWYDRGEDSIDLD